MVVQEAGDREFLLAIEKSVLIFGIPADQFFEELQKGYPPEKGWHLIVAEARPREAETAQMLERYLALGYKPTLISDNMMASCMQTKSIKHVFVFAWKREEGFVMCLSGSLLAVILAHEMGIPCSCYAGRELHGGIDGQHHFAGRDILPPGTKSYIPFQDHVSLQYVTGKLHGELGST